MPIDKGQSMKIAKQLREKIRENLTRFEIIIYIFLYKKTIIIFI